MPLDALGRYGLRGTNLYLPPPHHLGFAFLRTIHHDCLGRILAGTLFSNQPLTWIECWEGGVLPELLREASITPKTREVREHLAAIAQINQARSVFALSFLCFRHHDNLYERFSPPVPQRPLLQILILLDRSR